MLTLASVMIISRDFVFLHVPRTGGTFVRQVARRLSAGSVWARVVEAVLPFEGKYWEWINGRLLQILDPSLPLMGFGDYHGTCADIPKQHRHKRVVAVKRDPLAYYVSCYLYENDNDPGIYAWRESYRNRKEQEDISTEDDSFPDFVEFLKFFNEVFSRQKFFEWSGGLHMRCHVGFMTFISIWFFFRNPVEVLTKTDEELRQYFESRQWEQDICPVRFLRLEHLNQDLHDFLLEMGFNRKKLLFVLTKKEVNEAKTRGQEASYSEDIVNYIKEKEYIYYRFLYADSPPPPPPPAWEWRIVNWIDPAKRFSISCNH